MEPSKSILRKRNSTTAPLLRGATPTSARPTRVRKRVEITSPPQSVVSNEDTTLPKPKVFKQTPLPRVALLSSKISKKSLVKKQSSNIAIKLKTIRLRAKRSPSIPSHKISTKKGKRRSHKTGDENSSISSSSATHDYVKEIGTINTIIKSVVNPATSAQKGQALLEGMVRPLSADELGQLLKSIGNVATIHNIDGTSSTGPPSKISSKSVDDEDELPPGKREKQKSKTRKFKSRRRVSSLGSQKSIKLSSYLPLIKRDPQESKSKSYAVDVSGGKMSKVQLLMNKASSKPIPTTSKPDKTPVKKLKSMKSQVKALIKEQMSSKKSSTKKSKKKGRKGKGSTEIQNDQLHKTNSETAMSVLSDLDLIKSAILNKRYYEESMALAQSNSKDKIAEGSPTRRKRSQSSSAKKPNKSRSTSKNKQVPHTSVGESHISPIDSDASILSSRMESLHEVQKKSDPSVRKGFMQNTLKLIKNQKNSLPNNPPTTVNATKEALKLVKTEADNKQHLKDVLVNYSHVIRGPDPVSLPTKDLQLGDDGELYFTQRILTAPRFNAMSAELHDDTRKFEQHIDKTKSIQKRFGLGAIKETDQNKRSGGMESVLKSTPPPAAAPGKNKKNSRPTGAQKTGSNSSKNTTGDRKKRDDKSFLEEGFSTPHKRSHPPDPLRPINELYSYRNTLHKDRKEPIIKSLANAPSAWQQQSLYPSAYPSVVNSFGAGLFDKEERWSTLNQKTVKKNEELKDQPFESAEMDAIQRRIHPATPKRYEVDDENKILDSYATYMKVKGNIPAGGKDPNLTQQLIMKNK